MSGPGEAGLLEREREMESLRAVLAGARAGEGMVILVEGSPGAGKTSIRSRHQLREAIGGQ